MNDGLNREIPNSLDAIRFTHFTSQRINKNDVVSLLKRGEEIIATKVSGDPKLPESKVTTLNGNQLSELINIDKIEWKKIEKSPKS